ncbi:hypothetical protein [Arachidicoccus soli]|uniref:Chromosome partitioning protein ParA n=1 Tax=Arachidicoccus soli TaxID=2341117 RepID=A0A386HT42_9BACT|nr:hypothetical protein [Arachidicoccus soli]AYD49148.1 hypothetical protein D6B99_16875 [Arachidicoccus soli]
MTNTTYPSVNPEKPEMPNNKTPNGNKQKLILGVVIAALLITWAYIIYDKSKSNQEFAGLQLQAQTSDSAKNAIQLEYNDALNRMDSLTGSNTHLQGALAQQKSEIDQLKEKIEAIRKRDNGDLTKAKALIDELNGKVNDLFAQVATLKKQNAILTDSNQTLSSLRDTLVAKNSKISDSLTATASEKNHIIDEASTLHASDIAIEAIQVRGGKEQQTSRARKADLLHVSFTIDENRVAPSGPKDLYIIVTAPNGRVVSIPSQGSGTFQTREDGEKVYTNMKNIYYTQGQKQKVSFDWSQGDGHYQTGSYKVEIYNNGYKIGEGTTTLKKSGFLGL